MKRRSFLKSAAAIVPAGLQSIALAQAASPSARPDVHLVPAGQDRLGEFHSRGTSSILFKVLPTETNWGLFVLEHANMTRGGPPLHCHIHQEEWFYVIEGKVLFQLGDARKELGPGESVLGPRMVPHTFSYAGDKPGRMLIAFTPAGKMEEFLRLTGVPHPPVQDAAFFRLHDMELVGPSPLA
jgi:mannose-6-phosphate isomerase-like protein (cupin superfamily)